MEKSENEMNDWESQYRACQPSYVHFAKKLSGLVAELAEAKGIDVHTIESRAKSVEGFVEKIGRAGKSYENPLEEITDLAGVRVILYYQDDIDTVCDVLRSELAIDEGNSVDKRETLESDQFGYVSVHLVGSIGPKRSALLEWKSFSSLVVEIQVRTVLQHAWAAISHALQYKSSKEVPAKFRRKLVRLAGLLELGDEQFSELRCEQASNESQVLQKLEENDLKIEVDRTSVEMFLNVSKAADQIATIVQESGFKLPGDQPEGEIEPQLLVVCEFLDIQSIEKLEVELEECVEFARKFFPEFVAEYGGAGGRLDHWCAVSIMASYHEVLHKRGFDTFGLWHEDYRIGILKASKRVGKEDGESS